MSIWIYYIKWG